MTAAEFGQQLYAVGLAPAPGYFNAPFVGDTFRDTEMARSSTVASAANESIPRLRCR
jgi:hypothetical protein